MVSNLVLSSYKLLHMIYQKTGYRDVSKLGTPQNRTPKTAQNLLALGLKIISYHCLRTINLITVSLYPLTFPVLWIQVFPAEVWPFGTQLQVVFSETDTLWPNLNGKMRLAARIAVLLADANCLRFYFVRQREQSNAEFAKVVRAQRQKAAISESGVERRLSRRAMTECTATSQASPFLKLVNPPKIFSNLVL